MDRQMELAHLRLADRHIAEGELRIAAQDMLVERMRVSLQPLGPAEEYLALLRTTMTEWQHHRTMIVAALAE
jgi:mannose-6-phosphate isomerase-like protein (cupin superfamily)